MIRPIYAYGHPVLRRPGEDVQKDHPELAQLIADMFETMEHASGVGLAAPQIGLSLRLFVVDTAQMDSDKTPEEKGIRQVFINPEIIDEMGKLWPYQEGCLSIPDVREDVRRQPDVHMQWQDENFKTHEATFSGMTARVIQHEYDHVEGVLFTDLINPFRKRMIQRKLNQISRGDVRVNYKMKFPKR